MVDYLLTILRQAQKKHGYLSEEVLKKISTDTGFPISRIYGVATFYSMLHTVPVGENIIYICNSPSCHVNGSMNLIEFLEKELNIKPGETTEDKKFSLFIHECIGCCNRAPAMLMNGKVYDSLTEKKLKTIIEKARTK